PREPAHPRYLAFDANLIPGDPYASQVLDTETGAVGVLKIPGSGTFDMLSVSPWRDAAGQRHMVGRWRDATEAGHLGLTMTGGVARCTFPEGRVLDRVAIEPVLVTPPCWFPDRSDRILFAAGDGRLYLLDFRDGTGPE